MTLFRSALLLLLGSFLGGCSALWPSEVSRDERLSVMPRQGLALEKPVTIRWNRMAIPYVEAETDRDLAYTLGLVHGHLRLAQIRLMKQVAQGRLSEMVGPFAQDIDHAIRILDFGRAAPQIVAQMPGETRALMDAFLDGLNTYQARLETMPPEFGLLGLSPEPFTLEDLLTIGRLAGTDVNWGTYIALLGERDKPEWPQIWARTLEAGSGPTISFDTPQKQALNDLLVGLSKSGSNSVVVAPERSASGAAMIASDPHLGVGVPNLWLIAGVKSPSFNAVGFMIPGLPFVALGRTPDLAWGGTNMRAANSDLYDVSAGSGIDLVEEETEIVTRFWFNTTRTVRRSRLGNVITDSSLVPGRDGEAVALRWVGHLPTDEITGMFAIMRAQSAEEFRAALKGFAVSPQNFLCVDSSGNICHALATLLPKRPWERPETLVLDAAVPGNDWPGIADALELPFALNPDSGFIASANNRPTKARWPIGFFFNGDERIRRLQQILGRDGAVSLDDLKALQLDTVSLASAELSAALVALIEATPEAAAADPAFLAQLKAFDGDYAVDAAGPVAFETLLFHLVPRVYGAESLDALTGQQKNFTQLRHYLIEDMQALSPEARSAALTQAIALAATDTALHPTWGDMHYLQVQHWLGNAPVIGSAFQYERRPVGGSRETVYKTAHGLTNEPIATQYGSQARHISDMSDPDANYFVLLGGNDGWLGSENFLDQVDPWIEGGYVQMPLRAEIVARDFPITMTLSP